MSHSISRLAYEDIFNILEQAQGDPLGIRLPFAFQREARHWVARANQARKIDRQDNRTIYTETDHPLHGKSSYDKYIFRIKHGEDDTWFVYVEPITKFTPDIESLSEMEGDDAP